MIAEVRVQPGSKRFAVTLKDGKARISLKSPAEKDKANIELIRELSSALGCSVRILSGRNSRRKRMELDCDESAWNNFLASSSV
jgi:uncharacterized protein (TIGR00251 family)